jgi:nitroreductase
MDILPELLARHARCGIAAESLPVEQVQRLLCAATLAPSCANTQPWRIVAVTGESLPAVRQGLSEGNRWATWAPLIFVMATKPSLDMRLDAGRDYAYFDLGMAALALMLQATREGLYAHPIAGYTPSKVAKAAGLPEDFVPLNLIIVGKPGDDALLNEGQKLREYGQRQRKGLQEIAFSGSWEKAWGTGELGDQLHQHDLVNPQD